MKKRRARTILDDDEDSNPFVDSAAKNIDSSSEEEEQDSDIDERGNLRGFVVPDDEASESDHEILVSVTAPRNKRRRVSATAPHRKEVGPLSPSQQEVSAPAPSIDPSLTQAARSSFFVPTRIELPQSFLAGKFNYTASVSSDFTIIRPDVMNKKSRRNLRSYLGQILKFCPSIVFLGSIVSVMNYITDITLENKKDKVQPILQNWSSMYQQKITYGSIMKLKNSNNFTVSEEKSAKMGWFCALFISSQTVNRNKLLINSVIKI